MRSKLALVALFATLAACGGDSATAPGPPKPSGNDPVVGTTFVLSTVNTQQLPFALFDETGYKLEITSSTIAMQTGGQFVLALNTRETVAGFPSAFVDTTRGTWSQNAGAVTLTSTDGTTAIATWDGIKLSFNMENESQRILVAFLKP